MTLPRRAALLGAAALAGAAPPPEPGLNARALHNGRFYGTAIDSRILQTDAPYMAQVARECGVLTSETAFKWAALHPHPNGFDFTEADALLAFAGRHAMIARGHTLLWHAANPAWLTETLTPANAERLLRAHIAAVATHFRRRLVQWDVVNEMIDRQDGKPLALRDSLWTRALGPDCIDLAFHACAEADPGALRFINEYGIDYTWDNDTQKRQDLLALLTRLHVRGVPVQGLGIQAHLDAAAPLDQAKLAQFCNDVAALGLKIVITEFDVRDNSLAPDPAQRDAAVASHARAYLDAVLSCPAVMGVLSWGLSDRRTWLNDALPRADGLPQRPLPLDSALQRKPLWQAMADAFATAPPRS